MDSPDTSGGTPTDIVPKKKMRRAPEQKEVTQLADAFDQHLSVADPSNVIAAQALEYPHEKRWVYDDLFFPRSRRFNISRAYEIPDEAIINPPEEDLIKRFFQPKMFVPDCSTAHYNASWYSHLKAYFISPLVEDPTTINDDLALLQSQPEGTEQMLEEVEYAILDTHSRKAADMTKFNFFNRQKVFPTEEHLSNLIKETLVDDPTLVAKCNVDYHVMAETRPSRPPRAPIFASGRDTFYSHAGPLTDGGATYKDKSSDIYYTTISDDALSNLKNEMEWVSKQKPDFSKLFEQFHNYTSYLRYSPMTFIYKTMGVLETIFMCNDPDLIVANDKRLAIYQNFERDEWSRWFFIPLEQYVKGTYESKLYMQNKNFLQVLNGVDRLIPQTCNIKPFSESSEAATVERGPCKGLTVRHSREYNPRIIPLKFRGAVSNFDFHVRDKTYLNNPIIEDYFNSLCLRYALWRYDANYDDSFAHLFLLNLFHSAPNRFFYFEALRMLHCAEHSLTSQEVTILMEVQKKFDEPQSAYHLILAVDHLRNKNFPLMEEEMYNYCYSMRYGHLVFHTPFTEKYDDYSDPRCDMTFYLNYGALLSATFLLIATKNTRAYELSQNIINFETHPTELDDTQFCHAVSIQAKLKVLNVYDYKNDTSFFSPHSEFVKFATTINLFELETMSEHYITDMQAHYSKDMKSFAKIGLLVHRYLMAESLSLMYFTISGKHEAMEDFIKVQDRLDQYSYWTVFHTAVNAVNKAILQSHAFASGNAICPRGLPIFDDMFVPVPNRYDPPADATVCEMVTNAYRIAYTGELEDALAYIQKFENFYKHAIVGINHVRVAKACLYVDTMIFCECAEAKDVQDAIEELYEVCPVEGLFRHANWQMMSGTLSKKCFQRLMWIRNVCVQSKLQPLIQVRATMMIAQAMTSNKQYELALEELSTANELASHFGFESLVFAINRRIASALFFSGQYDAAIDVLEKYHPDESRTLIPMVEIGLYHYILFRCYDSKLKAYDPEADRSAHVPVGNVSGILADALFALENYNLIYHAVLIEAVEYFRYYLAHPLFDHDGNEPQFHKWAEEETFNRFREEFPDVNLHISHPEAEVDFNKDTKTPKMNMAYL